MILREYIMKQINHLERHILHTDEGRGVSYPPSMTEIIDKINEVVDAANELSANYAPINHGKWNWNGKYFECSVCCGQRMHDLVLGLDAAYCPRCGAKMDLED